MFFVWKIFLTFLNSDMKRVLSDFLLNFYKAYLTTRNSNVYTSNNKLNKPTRQLEGLSINDRFALLLRFGYR